jgi:hypothetical protein
VKIMPFNLYFILFKTVFPIFKYKNVPIIVQFILDNPSIAYIRYVYALHYIRCLLSVLVRPNDMQQKQAAGVIKQEGYDSVYDAIDQYNRNNLEKQQSQAKQHKLLYDTEEKKRVDNQQKKTMISTLSDYANNVKYIKINSNLDSRIRVLAANHPMSPDECDVYHSLVESMENSSIDAMPNHCISENGTMQGFRYTCSASDKSHCLPMHRKMFFRTSMVECKTGGSDYSNNEALELISQQPIVKKRLLDLMKSIYEESIGSEASFSCMPDNTDDMEANHHQKAIVGSYMSRKTADCIDWKPELPESVGLYHAYVRGFNRDQRSHKLFIVVSGGCDRICDSYFNLSLDVGDHMTCKEIFDSEETCYLKKVNQRNNAKIALKIAQAFSLSISTSVDPYSYEPSETACITSETLHYDIISCGFNRYSLMNRCVDTSSCRNGILFDMHAEEGVWVFKGPLQTSSTSMPYGGAFGDRNFSTCFPTCTYTLHPTYSWMCDPVKSSPCTVKPCIVSQHLNPAICYIDSSCDEISKSTYNNHKCSKSTYVDETYVNNLQQYHHWNRDNGIVELIPIAVIRQSSISN